MPFRDVIGQVAPISALRRSLAQGSLPHALLFVGPRGVGKRRVAAALAAAKYCEARRDGDGCGACATCSAAESGTHADIELLQRAAGKRDIGIAGVRLLQDALHRTSRSGLGRFAIVDGAERLTEDAQNAFLKTLEEPPLGATIVLIATSPDRLLPTIRSRCARFRFGALSREEIARFARTRPTTATPIPYELARGSPGSWLELGRDPYPEARRVGLDLLVDESTSPFSFAARWTELAEHEDEELPSAALPIDAPKNLRVDDEEEIVSDAAEVGRRRLLDWLLLVEWGLRDLALARRCGGVAELASVAVHSDRAADLFRKAEGLHESAVFSARDALDRARGDLQRNVDRTLALEAFAFAMARALRVP